MFQLIQDRAFAELYLWAIPYAFGSDDESDGQPTEVSYSVDAALNPEGYSIGYVHRITKSPTGTRAWSVVVPKVVAVSCSAVHLFSKGSQRCIRLLEGEGVQGDAHCGALVQHLYQKRRNPGQPNLCQVHLFAAEMLAELAAKGFDVAPGAIGENVLTEGIDLLALPQRSRLRLGGGAVVEVTGLRSPCSKMDAFRPGLQQHLWGERDPKGKRTRRAGVMCVVRSGGEVKPGDEIGVSWPAPPYLPLRPV